MRTKSPLQAEKILDVAARLFAGHRFHEARMEDIAAAAEVGKGTIYRYFKDKEELYLALLERAACGISQRLRRETESAETVRERLEGVIQAILGYFDENPHLFDLIQHAEAMSRPQALVSWQRWRDEVNDMVRQIFVEARESGAFAVADPELAALLLLGGLRSVLRFGSKPHAPDLGRRIADLLLQGAACPLEAGRGAPESTRL